MPNLDVALETIRARVSTNVFRGHGFERLVRVALLNHRGEFRDRFSDVWLWGDYPDRDGPDVGVDLVAREHDGKEWAVQCKNYASAKVATRGIDSFLAAAAPFDHRLFVSTSKSALPTAGEKKLQRAPNCRVLTFGDLNAWPVDWLEFVDEPENLVFEETVYEPRPYQQDAVDRIIEGFEKYRRGKLILPCGTGKSVVALWAAERLVGEGGRVLYVVPSISLLGQTMREWSTQRRTLQQYIGVCSDSSAGRRNSEDANLTELSIPVTTDPDAITEALDQHSTGVLTVVFCTYQSLGVIADAQDRGAAGFDLMICDEAHRTTGVEKKKKGHDTVSIKRKDNVSVWQAAHYNEIVSAQHRLYMTATPRLYSANVKEKAQARQVAVYSMDDEDTYGPVLYEMSFRKAVEEEYLSDYEVAIVAVSDGLYANLAGDFVAEHKETGVNVSDVVKLLGCWDALADPTSRGPGERVTGLLNPNHTARRAIAFSNTIKASKNLEKWWPDVIHRQAADIGREHDLGETLLGLDVEHIDGTTRASVRAQTLNELRAEIPEGRCRIVSNAKCLTEGVDVPALDAVLFIQPRRSKVDIVQAVGRVMRSSPGTGKKRGYIVLPVIVPEGKRVTDSDFLRSSDFQPVWDVISALRAHDERMDVWVNTADMGGKPPIIVISCPGPEESPDEDGDDPAATIQNMTQMSLPLNNEIASVLVERCGDKRYWATWGDDVGTVTNRIRTRIQELLDHPDRHDTRQAFDRFLTEMHHTINEHLQAETVIGMLAGHLVTLPVFEALFGKDEFAQHNPVVKALNAMIEVLDREGLVNEARDLDHFYQSVKTRVQEITDPDGRLRILLDLYESFFQRVEPKLASQAGIAYTPVEIVDFILRSADTVSRQEFGRSLTDEDVHILDPFAGTGTFIYRFLTLPGLITPEDLTRKYQSELHANECSPLAYCIAAVKIEQGYMTRRPDSDYQPFSGIVLTDTFELNPQQPPMPTMDANSERARKQAKLRIDVIVGNPPWSAGQRSAGEDNRNIPHPHMEQRIRETYAARSTVTNKRQMQDLYKMSIRWATDRIGDRGIIAFVTPNGFLDGNTESGMRSCLLDEFTTLYIFNLRGNARLQGEARRREKGNVFSGNTRVGVAVTVMARNPDASHSGCRIRYRDIGDYLTREQKLQTLDELGSIDGIDNWQSITSDEHHDWINQRDPTWKHLIPLGHKDAKAGRANAPDTITRLYSLGVATGADSYLYSFDVGGLTGRVKKMTDFYEQRRLTVSSGEMSLEEATENNDLHIIKWHRELANSLRRGSKIQFSEDHLRIVHHRPFVKQWLYFDRRYIAMVYRIPDIFPTGTTPNQTIGVSGRGSTVAFSTFVTSTTPDLELVSKGQMFPRHHIKNIHLAEDEQTTQVPPPHRGFQSTRQSTSPARERASDSQLSSRPPLPTCTSSPAGRPSRVTATKPSDRNHRTWVERGLLSVDHERHPRYSVHGQRTDVSPIQLRPQMSTPNKKTGDAVHPKLLDLDDPANTADPLDEYGRVDNITDWCLTQFQQHYNSTDITKDDIWAYIYGVLHAEDWRNKYANDLRKGLPRIPFAPDFWTFKKAGQSLIDLHLGYETCEPWPLTVTTPDDPEDDSFYRIESRMRWDKTRNSDGKLVENRNLLHINNRCRIEGIPDEAHLYIVNGKTPLEWAIDRLKITTDKASGITNDPNRWHEWADEPANLVLHLQRLVRVSIETHRIVSKLPAVLTDQPDHRRILSVQERTISGLTAPLTQDIKNPNP